MRFFVANTNGPRRRAKMLQRLLNSLGYDARLRECHELMAQMLGYSNYHELHTVAGTSPPSSGDSLVDDRTRAARRTQHISVLIDAGIAPEDALAAIDEIRPTAYSSYNLGIENSPISVSVADQNVFEQEWGLRGSERSVKVETRRSRGIGRNPSRM